VEYTCKWEQFWDVNALSQIYSRVGCTLIIRRMVSMRDGKLLEEVEQLCIDLSRVIMCCGVHV